MKRMQGQKNHHGFTLLELLLTSAVVSIVLVGMYTAYSASHTTTVRGENRAELQQNARVAMEMMAREIRMAGYDPNSAIPNQPPGQQTAIQVAGANTLTFIADVDGDGSTDWIRYRLDGMQFIRDSSSWVPGAPGTWNPATATPNSSIWADAVRPATDPAGPGLVFAYFDASDGAPVTLGDIRRITITLRMQETAGGRVETFPVMMDVRLRN